MKRTRNAMDNRHLLGGFDDDDDLYPANLKMLQRSWAHVEGTGAPGGKSRLGVTKFTLGHFVLTRATKMRVALAVHALSQSAIRMIKDAHESGGLATAKNAHLPAFAGYKFLLQLNLINPKI